MKRSRHKQCDTLAEMENAEAFRVLGKEANRMEKEHNKKQDMDWKSLTEEEDAGETKEGEGMFDIPEDLEEYDDIEEPREEFEEILEEEKFSLRPWMIPVFAGMLILAILICIPLWMLTHRNRDEGLAGNETAALLESVSDTLAEESVDTQDSADAEGEIFGAGQEALPQQDNPETGSANEAVQGQEDTASDAGAQDGQIGQADTGNQSGQTGQDGTGNQSGQAGQAGTGNDTAGSSGQVQEPVSGTTSMSFQEVSDSVTAKDVTNLRSAPSTEDEENVVGQLNNGETLARTGVNEDTGWSRLTYNGETVYAVTQYLTTDLGYKPPVTAANPNRVSTLDGRVIIFVDSDDYVTPKEYVNLRTEPSTSEGDSTVRCQVSNGETLHRTGYSPDSGWSRVEYNGESLYVVSSFVQGVAAE